MSDLTIRPATADDLDVIVDFNARIASETEDTVLDRNTLRAGVQVLLEDPAKGRYFVACVDGVVVGQVMHPRDWSDWRTGDIWWIQSVYVHADHRRRAPFRRALEKCALDRTLRRYRRRRQTATALCHPRDDAVGRRLGVVAAGRNQ